MDNKKVLKQMIEFHKKSFDNCFSIMVTLQQQAENILNFFHYLPIMTDEGKKFMKERTSLYKNWIDELKKAMNEGYAKVEAFYDDKTMQNLHDQTRKIFKFYMDQSIWMPPHLKKLLEESDALYQKGCDEFKTYVEQNRQQVENYYKNLYRQKTKAGK